MRIGLHRKRPRLVPPDICCLSVHGVAQNEPQYMLGFGHIQLGGMEGRERRKKGKEMQKGV